MTLDYSGDFGEMDEDGKSGEILNIEMRSCLEYQRVWKLAGKLRRVNISSLSRRTDDLRTFFGQGEQQITLICTAQNEFIGSPKMLSSKRKREELSDKSYL